MIIFKHSPNFCKRYQDDSRGFATAEWVVLMTFTVVLLAGMVQALYVENIRASAISTLRDAARSGTREGDLQRIQESPSTTDDYIATEACRNRLVNSLAQTTRADTSQASCEIGNVGGRFYMEARVGGNFDDVALVPGAAVFRGRINNLKARYFASQNAR